MSIVENLTAAVAVRKMWAIAIVGLSSLSLVRSIHAQRDDYSDPPINYSATTADDPVSALSRKVESGDLQLQFDDRGPGYLSSLLEALDIPVSSQTLVFSKTSMQQSRISPERPRAIYFNDDVYVGFVQNGEVIELTATDPDLGAVFYTLEQNTEAKPQFVRDRGQCLTCHSSNRTQNVPGYLLRSVFSKATGLPEFGSGTFTTDHTSPFEDRWGGWYVTGTHGEMRHMGNAILKEGELDRESHANLTSLAELVSTAPYLSPHSDIVALMVMEHQTQMHNAIAWASFETRRAIHQSGIMNEALDRPDDFLSESGERRINRAVDRVLEYLLMCDEFKLTSPVRGTSDFSIDFVNRGIHDSRGRSLRDFDLETRMFRHPCSYMIYSEAFDGLPEEVRSRILVKLRDILDGKFLEDDTEKFAHLSDVDRRDIRQILTETKPDFTAIAEGAAK